MSTTGVLTDRLEATRQLQELGYTLSAAPASLPNREVWVLGAHRVQLSKLKPVPTVLINRARAYALKHSIAGLPVLGEEPR